MKPIKPLLGVGLILGSALSAQEDAKPRDAAATFAALQAEIATAQQEHMAKAREAAEKARVSGERVAAISMRPDMGPFVEKFAAAAVEFAGTDDAAMFHVWVAQNGRGHGDAVDHAVECLVQDHAASEHLVPLARMGESMTRALGSSNSQSLMAAMREHNKSPVVLGWLAVAEHGPTIDNAEADSEEYKAAKAALLAFTVPEHDKGLTQTIQNRIDMREKLGIGAIAPDIVGVDLDGEAFKLSDYKGKVVFLDFWGDW